MKGLIKMLGISTIILMLISCVVHEHHGRRGRPPGHARKVYIYEKKGPGHGHGHHRGRGHRHHR
ncbi:hypothetical protein VUJ46_03980 [Chryseobacterium sp. MYb264]|uniref:hypothetical protein n=1 Tax=Chryseobacterium sp. MYb264 TaxID=2745153 RepID=UPI002E0E730A|nr:hypothetical protein VUJ46_03980 [Chryseobacterium sp. MYb264]